MAVATGTWGVPQFDDEDEWDALLVPMNLLGQAIDRIATAILAKSTPVGTIIEGAWSSAPSGFLLCQGQSVSRVDYADLFEVCSLRYGVGNGTTTFGIPNFQGRVPVGLNGSQTDFSDLGKFGGSRTETLTIEQMPSHNHSVTPNGRLIGDGDGTGSAGLATTGDGYAFKPLQANAGGGAPHNNLQPFLVVNFAIKY